MKSVNAITDWQELLPAEQHALARALGAHAQDRFAHDFHQAGRDSLINIFYLMASESVAGDLWRFVRAIRWAEANQLGIETDQADELEQALAASKNFRADGRLVCRYKRACWSWRELFFINEEGQRAPIREHGLQIYRPAASGCDDRLARLVVDIDTIVFSGIIRWPAHAIDILWPRARLNDPLVVRSVLASRGIFPRARLV